MIIFTPANQLQVVRLIAVISKIEGHQEMGPYLLQSHFRDLQ
jgi:hypothetical protein